MLEFLQGLSEDDAAEVAAALHAIAKHGIGEARHLEGEIYEVRADGRWETFRILFAQEGKHDQVLLSLEAFSKKTRQTPRAKIEIAKRRLRDWRSRSRRGSLPSSSYTRIQILLLL